MPPQQPTESEILTSYLLHPSSLPTILPYKSFLALVPPGSSSTARQHPTELKRLYRDLQFQRDIVIDDVRRRIQDECRRSVELAARLGRQVRMEEGLRSKKRKRKDSVGDENENQDEVIVDDVDAEEKETRFDTALHNGQPLGSTLPSATPKHNHTTTTLLTAMTTACEDLTSEIADLEAQIDALRKQCEDRVGNLSDLRYGRFATASGRVSGDRKSSATTTMSETPDEIEDEIVAGVKGLEETLMRHLE